MANRSLNYFTYRTPLGPVSIAASRTGIAHVTFGEEAPPGAARQPSALTNQAANELAEYLTGKRRSFAVPIDPEGSDFQRRVWAAACAIPYGEIRTCAEVARAIDAPRSYRAVGAAVRKNPLPVLVPCHRVVNAAGAALGGGEARHRAALMEFERIRKREGA